MKLKKKLISLESRISNVLEYYLNNIKNIPEDLEQALKYAVLSGGKRLRPILVYLCGESLGAKLEDLDPVACSVELMHCYSLIHDDLPAMDNDDLRRGQASCHKRFGEATAILVGDALQALAFEILCQQAKMSDRQKVKMIHTLATLSGFSGMVAGQALDLGGSKKVPAYNVLEQIYDLKTGSLFSACTQLAAIAANRDDDVTLASMKKYAYHLGLAFQIQDDLTDSIFEGKNSTKTVNGALKQEISCLDYISIDAAQEKVNQLYQQAKAALMPLDVKPEMLIHFVEHLQKKDQDNFISGT